MELREDGSFDLSGFSPHLLTFLPATNCLLATDRSGGARCLDLTSGVELFSAELASPPASKDDSPAPVLCLAHPSTSKLVVVQGKKLGARGTIGGSVMLKTILQTAASKPSDEVCIEVPVAQVPPLVQELRALSPNIKSTLAASVLKQLETGVFAGIKEKTRNSSEKKNKWATLSFHGPVQQLSELFEELLSKLKPSVNRTTVVAPSISPSPALPLVAAINVRLMLLRPDHTHLSRLEEEAEMTVNESKMMYCEAVRRLSLSKWPHKDYVWAVPKTMASAGFYHLCNPPTATLTGKGDRVSCFACRVYLHSWESTDEPWSEHERHAMQCPYMRGEHTDNVPAAVTEGTHPARVCAGADDSVTCVSTAANCGLLATATRRGHITLWDLNRSLYLLEHAKLEITDKIVNRCSNAREYRFSRFRREKRWAFREREFWEEEEMLLAERELREAEAEAAESSKPSEKQNFHVTALSVLAYPEGSSSSRSSSSPVLVTGVSLVRDGKAVPLLIIHNIRRRRVPENPKSESSKLKAVPAHEDSLVDYWDPLTDPLYTLPPYPLPSMPVSSGPTSAPPSNMLDVLSESKGGDAGTAAPLPAVTHFMYGVPLNEFSTSIEGLLPEIQHIVPLDGGRRLAVSIGCAERGVEGVNDSCELPHGGLLLYRVFSYSREVTDVEIDYPIRTVRFSSEKDAIVCMCILEDAMLEQRSGSHSYSTDVIATVTRGGEIVLYEIKRLSEVARFSPKEGEEGYTSCTYCAQSNHLAATTSSGRVVLLHVTKTLPPKEKESEIPRVVDENHFLSRPLTSETLDQFVALTKTSHQGIPFAASASHEWTEISFLQYHRRSPVHMHLPQEAGQAMSTKIWQYQPPPANTGADSIQLASRSWHLFELFPAQHPSPYPSPIGSVSIKFSFTNAQCLSDKASVSLLLPKWDQPEGERPKHKGPLNAEPICGPVKLKPLIDVTGQSAQVCFCHSRLLSCKSAVFWLLIEDLFSSDYNDITAAGDPAINPSLSPHHRGNWRTRAFRHHVPRSSDSNGKMRPISEHSTIAVTFYPLSSSCNVDNELDLLLKLIRRAEFVMLVVLTACGYRVESAEFKALSSSLQVFVEEGQSVTVEGQFKAMELLCWMAVLDGCKAEREGVVVCAVSQLLTSLLRACFIQGNRMLSHKCVWLLVSLCRSEDDILGENQFHSTLTSTLSTLLPLLPLTQSAASIHWFLRLVATVGGPCDSHMISTLCLTLLVELTKHLSAKSSSPAQLLQTHFQQEGSILEPELCDIYLSYCHKATSKQQQKASSLHSSVTSALPPDIPISVFPSVIPSIIPAPAPTYLSSSSPSSSSSSVARPHPVTNPKVHTIYDSELQLLLDCSNKTDSEAYKSISEFTTFKHGSFLLYSQRGLLETQPMEYSCVSFSGNTTVQEPASQSVPAATVEGLTAMAPPVTKTSGYHFPTARGRKQERSEGIVSQPVPPILTDIKVLPKELMMQIDAVQSGVAYSVVIRFPQLIALTDISIPPAMVMSSVSVDVWMEKGGEGKAVRVVHSSEIKDKSVAIGNLMPPPLCQFAKVTFVGRLGASREKAQVFLGSFFGQPVFTPGSPLPSALLYSLEEMLLGQYLTAREKLTASLTAYAGEARKGCSTSNATALKQCESTVTSSYQNCFKAQVQLARLRNFIRAQVGGTTKSEERYVFKVEEELQKLDLSEMTSSWLYKLVGCLVDALLILNDHDESPVTKTGLQELEPVGLESDQLLPTLSETDCSLLFMTLCVHGVPKLHARPCAMLIRLCGSEPWWGRFATNTALQLFSSSQTAVFNRERTLLQLSALCQRTYQCSDVMKRLFQLLEEKLSPLLKDQTQCLDQLLLQWLILLLSHLLSSLSQPKQTQNQSNLFAPVLNLPLGKPQQGEGEGEEERGAMVDPRAELGERRREMKRRLAELQHKMKILVGEEKLALRHEYEAIIQDYRAQRKQQQQRRVQGLSANREPTPLPPPPPRPVEPDTVLSSLPTQLCLNVARGLMHYVLTLISSRNWELIPVACTSLSQLVILSGHKFTLHSLLSQHQLDQLLTFCCQRPYSCNGGGPGGGSLEWGQRALQCLLINSLYHGEIAPHLKVLVETEKKEEGTKGGKHGGAGVHDGEDSSGRVSPNCEFQTQDVVSQKETDTQVQGEDPEQNDKPQPSDTKIETTESAAAKVETSPKISEMSDTKSVAIKSEGPPKTEESSTTSPAMVASMPNMEPMESFESFKPFLHPLQGLQPPFDPLLPGLPSHTMIVHKAKDVLTQHLTNEVKHHHPPGSQASVVIKFVSSPPDTKFPVHLKKLSKHSLMGKKYAAGDYTEVPVYKSLPESVDPQLPYQTFIISSTVEHRLQSKVEFPVELELQWLSKKVYESVLLALLHARPSPPLPLLGVSSGAAKTEEDGSEAVEVGAEPGSISASAAMLCSAIETLLESVVTSESNVNPVAVLELWNVLNSLLPANNVHLLAQPHKPPLQEPSSTILDTGDTQPTSEQHTTPLKENVRETAKKNLSGLPIFSTRALSLLLDSLLVSSSPPSARMWQLAISLLHTTLRHKAATVAGGSADIDASKLMKVLVRLFSSTSDTGGVQPSAVTAMLLELAPMRLAGREEERGVCLLLEVLVTLLENCTTSPSPLSSPLFVSLIHICGAENHERFLWDNSPSPSLCHHLARLLRRLILATVSLLPTTLESTQQPNVVLYGAEVDEDRRRYRYLSGANQEVKWLPLLSAESNIKKGAAKLVQLLKELLSLELPQCALLPLQEFCQNEFGSDFQPGRDFLKLSHSSTPLLSLVFADSELLTSLLRMLNFLPSTDEKSHSLPPKGNSTLSSELQNGFCRFVDHLNNQCEDHSRFFPPILQILTSKRGERPLSKAFMSLFESLTSKFEKENLEQLQAFIHDGGAKLIFDHFTNSCKHCKHSSPSLGNVVAQSISKLGQKEAPKPFRENSNLVNFLPSASIRLSPSRTSVRDLQFSGLHPSRASTFHHTFQADEEWLKMFLSLPQPILLHAVQLYQPMGLMQNGPSAILIECASQSSLASPVAVTPVLQTSGLSCIKVELQCPIVAQEVVIHLRRPLVMDGLSLSHMHLLGVGYGGNNSALLPGQEGTYPSAGWLYIIDQWLSLSGAIRHDLMTIAAATPDLLPSCLSLLHSEETLGLQSSNQLMRLLVAMATHSPEHGLAIVKHLLLLSFKEPTALGGRQVSMSITVTLDLLLSLCLPASESSRQRLMLALRLLSNLPSSLKQLPLSHHLPPLVRTLSSVLWQGREEGEDFIVEEDVFSSLVETAFSQEIGSPLKLAFNSLVCSLCHCQPELFPLVLTNCQEAMRSEHPNVSNLLQTLAQAAQSPQCNLILLESDLATGIMKNLRDGLSELLEMNKELSEEKLEQFRSTLSKSCMYLAFLSDLCRNWIPAKNWVGTPENSAFWPILVRLLSSSTIGGMSSVEVSFCQQVACEFFEDCVCGHAHNKALFAKLLCNVLRGSVTFSSNEPSPLQDDTPLSGEAKDGKDEKLSTSPVLTFFLHKLIVDLVLKLESVPIVLKEQEGADPMVPTLMPPPPPLSFPPTHEAPHFHPSFPIGQGSYCLQLPATYTMEDLAKLCQNQGPQQSVRDTETKKKLWPWIEPSGNNLDVAKFKLKSWKLFSAKVSQQAPATKDVTFATPSEPDSRIPLNVELSCLAQLNSMPTSSLRLFMKHHLLGLEVDVGLNLDNWLVVPEDNSVPSFKRREDFTSDQEYGQYTKATLQAGMRVRARVNYQSVSEGDYGIYKQTNDGTPPAQFAWDGLGGNTYWVYWHMVEILPPASEDDDENQDPAMAAYRQPNSRQPYVMRSLALPSTTGGPEGPGEIPLTQPHCCHPLSPQPSSLLELFIQQGGLQSLAECVPSLYPFLWPEKLANRTVSKPTPPPGCKPHFLLHIPSSLPFHSTVMLSLGLRLGCYGNIMRENLPVSFVLLRLMLGVELKDPIPRPTLDQLSFLPYLILLQTFKHHPPSESAGSDLRHQALEVGAVHHTLHCLSSFGHHSPRIEDRDDTNGSKPVEGQSSQQPSRVTSSSDKQYWAKGTGFGTGSTTSTWNMEAMMAKQKSEEKYVTLCFAILSEFLAVSEECPQPVYCGPEVMSLLGASCLLPALAAYLLNDSVLDISKHVELYHSVLNLLLSLAVNPSLRPLLVLPVFSNGGSGSSDDTSLATLTSKLRDITTTYQKTVKLKPADPKLKQKPPHPPPSPPPPASISSKDVPSLPFQQPKSPTPSSTSEEADLTELVTSILSTSEKVAAVVQELERGREERRKESTSPQNPLDDSSSAYMYMKVMKTLQFGTHLFTEENAETGRTIFHVPFHYESNFHNASYSLMYSVSRARRIAQEVTAISSSLPLSPSSSVFVRCDIERLDVMKVMITGPSETPYANGCFDFDVFFPGDYPRSPMLVNLMTTGHGRVRFNPNLYNDGKVCLSVLNTWHGRPEEKWNPETSSFLQVLVSIQSLILVPEPYFNEPGYEQYQGTPYGDQKSLAYNANLYVATVQWAMINQIRNPAPCFKEVILRHFYMRREEVLAQCEQWKKELANGIQSMQEARVPVVHLKESLRNLVKSVDTLQAELEKIKPSDFGAHTDDELGYANDELPISIT